ncbi:hypothetical protein BDV24DRAFT_166815 [Aspergillus arachidicola]|uniref:Extracellular membrane protein CFEM domain-containing protein n=1 Tax=Aspergillus arachidicola TaxID=656916 RepID=A0A5N6Y088_9EURO|nr:hypothetical protein BDV24DRAFT_166815 [Aspergillus arachidicola]
MRTIIVSLFVVVLASAIPAPINIASLLNPVSPASPVNPVNPVNPVSPANPDYRVQVAPLIGIMTPIKRFIPGRCLEVFGDCVSSEDKGDWKVECSTKCTEGLCTIDTGRGANVNKPTAKCDIRKSDIMRGL